VPSDTRQSPPCATHMDEPRRLHTAAGRRDIHHYTDQEAAPILADGLGQPVVRNPPTTGPFYSRNSKQAGNTVNRICRVGSINSTRGAR
jgi:hypothetical protein